MFSFVSPIYSFIYFLYIEYLHKQLFILLFLLIILPTYYLDVFTTI